ncbi:hypothetical protein RCO25_08285 [Paenibacillus sp. LHD-38]|nr:hypothetical protein [Paenibacillus sp. LHD-38]MDQ8734495.1 hypothetical protein [Paenibacillus sp. LHD-38]
MARPSKYILYQDVLLGLFDKHLEGGPDLAGHYSEMGRKWHAVRAKTEEPFSTMFEFFECLSMVAAVKGPLGLEITRLYKGRNMEELTTLVQHRLPSLITQVNELRRVHRRLWMLTNKAQGWEDQDIRYGGIMARLHTAAERLEDFLEGRVDLLEELEQQRLMFEPQLPDGQGPLTIDSNSYQRIAGLLIKWVEDNILHPFFRASQ